jgi:hypothetical protein
MRERFVSVSNAGRSLSAKIAIASPVVSRIVKVSIRRNLQRHAGGILFLEAPLAIPVGAAGIKIGALRDVDGYALLSKLSEPTLTFPGVS